MGNMVVTGCASGIGKAVADHHAAQGHKIIGIDLKNADIEADLSTLEGRQAAIDAALELSGNEIDGLVTAAGMGGHLADGKLVAIVNYFGTVELLDGLFPAMQGRPNASAVALSSNSAQFRIDPDDPVIDALLAHDIDKVSELVGDQPSYMTYGKSKHAVSRAVRQRAGEWGAAGVRLNAIAPGQTETPLLQGTRDNPELKEMLAAVPIPLQRTASADEIARIIVSMMGEELSFMHGSIVFVDGGTDALLRPDGF